MDYGTVDPACLLVWDVLDSGHFFAVHVLGVGSPFFNQL